MENTNPDIQEIIIRHLQQQTSQPEEKQLRAWLEESPQNKAGFEEIKRVWKETNHEVDSFVPDTSAAWEKVKRQTVDAPQAKPVTGGKVVQMPFRYLQIAASVLILLVAGYGFGRWLSHETEWTTVVSLAEKKQVRLPDSSVVWLNANSSLSWSDFEGDKREVKLDGEAFFDVKRKPEQPFRIAGNESLTEVLGTSFNLKSRRGAHDQVEVVTGLVAFSSPENPKEKLKLTPGKKGKIGPGYHVEESAIENPNFRSWQTDRLSFENTGMDEVAQSLESYFGVPVQIQDSALVNCRFTGSFEKPKLNDVIQVLSLSVNLQAEQKDGIYLLKGSGCR